MCCILLDECVLWMTLYDITLESFIVSRDSCSSITVRSYTDQVFIVTDTWDFRLKKCHENHYHSSVGVFNSVV